MPLRDLAKTALQSRGLRLQRLTAEERSLGKGFDDRVALPHGAVDVLRPDNAHLTDLVGRYSGCQEPVCSHTQWAAELDSDVNDLRYFRGDNAYLWQYSRAPELNRLKYFIYAQYTLSRAQPAAWKNLTEDGLFGCFTFQYEGLPLVSRDLLDSVNELSFLDRHLGLLAQESLTVVDIGAGFGRLAHRMAEAVPGLQAYWCLDAVPRSTFLCEYYLRFRGVDQAHVVPVDKLDSALPDGRADLAVNVHSFSEMSRTAVEGWFRWLADREVASLLVVPNEREQVLSREVDGSRVDCSDLIAKAGYRLRVAEPTIEDPAVRELFGVHDCFLLYDRV